MTQECVERIETFFQKTFHVVNGVEQSGISFDQAPSDHFHRARFADARLIVAIDIGAHGQLGFFFGRVEQVSNLFRVDQGIIGAARGACDGTGLDTLAFHPDKHFRGCPYQLLIAQLQQKFVRTGVGFLACAMNNSEAGPE